MMEDQDNERRGGGKSKLGRYLKREEEGESEAMDMGFIILVFLEILQKEIAEVKLNRDDCCKWVAVKLILEK